MVFPKFVIEIESPEPQILRFVRRGGLRSG
jgi:hypothetical protein